MATIMNAKKAKEAKEAADSAAFCKHWNLPEGTWLAIVKPEGQPLQVMAQTPAKAMACLGMLAQMLTKVSEVAPEHRKLCEVVAKVILAEVKPPEILINYHSDGGA